MLRRVRFPVIDADRLSVAVESGCIPASCCKGEGVGGEKVGFLEAKLSPAVFNLFIPNPVIGDGHPFFRDVERERESGLEIGLIETGEQCPRPVRHQKGVQEFRPPVERSVIRDEGDGNLVLSLAQRLRRNDDVLVPYVRSDIPSVDGEPSYRLGSRPEIQLQHSSPAQVKAKRDLTRAGLFQVLWNTECQVVTEIGNIRPPLPRKLNPNPTLNRLFMLTSHQSPQQY